MRRYLGSGRYQGAGETLPDDLAAKMANTPLRERLAYRSGDYAQFRRELLERVTLDPRLRQWTYRGADDPAVALLETAATVGEILALYGELYASEAFLGTARWPDSIEDLVRLSGYRLSPALGGQAEFAFEIKGNNPVTVPVGFPVKAQLAGQDLPHTFESSAERILYPAFSQFQLYRPVVPSQGIGRWRVLARQNTNRFFFDAPNGQVPPVAIAPGDRLLVGVDGRERVLGRPRVVVVKAVDKVLGLTVVTLEGSGYGLPPRHQELSVYKIRDTYRHFGHDAPPSDTTTSGATILYANWRSLAGETTGLYPARNISGSSPIIRKPFIKPTLGEREFPLDRELNDLMPGETLAIDAPILKIRASMRRKVARPRLRLGIFNKHPLRTRPRLRLGDALRNEYLANQAPQRSSVHIRKIASVTATTMTWGAINGPTSMVTLDQSLAATRAGGSTAVLGGIRLHRIAGAGMTFKPWLQSLGAQGNMLTFYGTEVEAEALVGRRMLVSGEGRADQILTVTGLVGNNLYRVPGPTLRRIYVDQRINYADFPLEQGSLTVNANLVPATQGKREAEVALGGGDPNQAFQSFRIPRKPLTYLTDTKMTPPEVPQLEVRVSGQLWTLVSSLYGQAPDARVYVVREDPNGFSWVQFGDGVTGLRPDRGVDNVTAVYRHGAGAHGPMEAGQQPAGGAKLDGLKAIRLAGVVTGGTVRESTDNARQAAPGKVIGLGRIVSLADVEHELLAIAGVEKVRVDWQVREHTSALVATVLMEKGRDAELEQVRKTIHEYNHSRGSARFPIVLIHGSIAPVYIKLRFGLDPSWRREQVEAAIREALGASSQEHEATKGLFALATRAFGQKEYARTVEGVVASLPGVTWAEVSVIRRAASADFGRAFNPFVLGRWRGFLLRIPRTITLALRSRTLSCPANSVLVLDQANLVLEPSLGEAP